MGGRIASVQDGKGMGGDKEACKPLLDATDTFGDI